MGKETLFGHKRARSKQQYYEKQCRFLADLLILGLSLTEGSAGSFLQAEHVFGFPLG